MADISTKIKQLRALYDKMPEGGGKEAVGQKIAKLEASQPKEEVQEAIKQTPKPKAPKKPKAKVYDKNLREIKEMRHVFEKKVDGGKEVKVVMATTVDIAKEAMQESDFEFKKTITRGRSPKEGFVATGKPKKIKATKRVTKSTRDEMAQAAGMTPEKAEKVAQKVSSAKKRGRKPAKHNSYLFEMPMKTQAGKVKRKVILATSQESAQKQAGRNYTFIKELKAGEKPKTGIQAVKDFVAPPPKKRGRRPKAKAKTEGEMERMSDLYSKLNKKVKGQKSKKSKVEKKSKAPKKTSKSSALIDLSELNKARIALKKLAVSVKEMSKTLALGISELDKSYENFTKNFAKGGEIGVEDGNLIIDNSEIKNLTYYRDYEDVEVVSDNDSGYVTIRYDEEQNDREYILINNTVYYLDRDGEFGDIEVYAKGGKTNMLSSEATFRPITEDSLNPYFLFTQYRGDRYVDDNVTLLNGSADLRFKSTPKDFKPSPMSSLPYEIKKIIEYAGGFEYFSYGEMGSKKSVNLRDGSWGDFYIAFENVTLNEIKEALLPLAETVKEDLEEKGIKGYGELGYNSYGNYLDLEISEDNSEDNEEDYAEGGMTEHGLEIGDKILGARDTKINVYGEDKDLSMVDLDTGKRKDYAKGGGVKDKYVFKYVIFDEDGEEVDSGVEEGFGKTYFEAGDNLLTRLEEGLDEGEEVEIKRFSKKNESKKFAEDGKLKVKGLEGKAFRYWEYSKPKDINGDLISFEDFKEDMKKSFPNGHPFYAKGGSTSTKKEKDEVILDILFRDFPDTSNQIMDYIDEKRREEAEPAEWGDEEEEPAELSSEEQDEMILDVLIGGYPKIYDKITDYIDELAS